MQLLQANVGPSSLDPVQIREAQVEEPVTIGLPLAVW
jgi:hypothetical protein